MTKIGELTYRAVAHLPPAAWDLKSFLENAKSYVQTVRGVLLMLLGAAGLVWGGVLLIRKLMGNQQQSHQHGWGQITMLVLVGGALGTGGWQLISTVGSGGQTTIEELGGGTITSSPSRGRARQAPPWELPDVPRSRHPGIGSGRLRWSGLFLSASCLAFLLDGRAPGTHQHRRLRSS